MKLRDNFPRKSIIWQSAKSIYFHRPNPRVFSCSILQGHSIDARPFVCQLLSSRLDQGGASFVAGATLAFNAPIRTVARKGHQRHTADCLTGRLGLALQCRTKKEDMFQNMFRNRILLRIDRPRY